MRSFAFLVALGLPGLAAAQIADFKIYPGAVTQFDQSCTSFTSRCALGAPGGEVLQEYPMASRDVNGAATDFFRGIGQVSIATCQIDSIYYITQDQNCSDQESYDLIVRRLNPGSLSGPDTNNATAPLPPGAITLLTPPNGPPSPCAWAITVILATSVTVPCASSVFVGMSLANNPAWTADGQSLQGSWLQGGGAAVGDPAALDAAQISWQITPAGVVGQCGSRRVWDIGVSTKAPTAMTANIHGDPICSIDPATGIGGLYPSNSARGDGLALRIRDSAAFRPDGDPVLAFMSFSVSPIEIPLPGILSANSIWIGPNPFIQIAFGSVTISGGVATLSPAFLAAGRNVGRSGFLWFQGLIARFGLPFPMTNAVAASLDPMN